jgi:hypothetical protein
MSYQAEGMMRVLLADDFMRSLASLCANGRSAPVRPADRIRPIDQVHSTDPTERVYSTDPTDPVDPTEATETTDPTKRASFETEQRRPVPVKLVMRANSKDCAGCVVTAARGERGCGEVRRATVPRCRKPMVLLAPRARVGTVAQHRARCRLMILHLPQDEKPLRGFRGHRSSDLAAPMARTEPCDALRAAARRAYWRESATSGERFSVRGARTHRNAALPERATRGCDLPTCAGSPSSAYRDKGPFANRMQSKAPEFSERRRRPAQWQDSMRTASIRQRAVVYGIRGWIRRTSRLGDGRHVRGPKNRWNRSAHAISFWLPTTERAEGRKLLQAPRAKASWSERVPRWSHRRLAFCAHREPNAPCARRFPLRPTHRRLGRIPCEDWRPDSGAQVRRLPGNFLTTLLGIRAAAGCCSWNLPGLQRSRLREKRKRKVTYEVRAAIVPASRYLRKRKKSPVDIRSSANRWVRAMLRKRWAASDARTSILPAPAL